MTLTERSGKCDELLTQYIDHLKSKKKPSAYIIEKCIDAHIRPFFGPMRANRLEMKDFQQYRTKRLKQDNVSNATVDHDFTYLTAALRHEHKKTPSRVVRVPYVEKSGEDNVREGFLEFDGYECLLNQLILSLKCLLVVGYHIGNRKGVLLDLKWKQVDFDKRVIRFIRMQNRKPVPIAAPIYGDMMEWLQRQHAYGREHFTKCHHVSFGTPRTP